MPKTLSILPIVLLMLAGCGGGWSPWSRSGSGSTGPYTPPGATAYACEDNKRLLVRFEADRKSAWVIYPDRQVRLERIASGAGDQYSNGRTLLAIRDGDTSLTDSGAVEFAKCRPEGKQQVMK